MSVLNFNKDNKNRIYRKSNNGTTIKNICNLMGQIANFIGFSLKSK